MLTVNKEWAEVIYNPFQIFDKKLMKINFKGRKTLSTDDIIPWNVVDRERETD